MPPKMDRVLGRVSALRGVEAVVGLVPPGTVLVVLEQGGRPTAHHGYDAAEAGDLAARLEAAADTVANGEPATNRTDAPSPRFVVRAQWPTVAVWLADRAGARDLGLDFSPRAARELAQLLRRAAAAK